jgi:hypothetical protein
VGRLEGENFPTGGPRRVRGPTGSGVGRAPVADWVGCGSGRLAGPTREGIRILIFFFLKEFLFDAELNRKLGKYLEA